MNQLMSLGTRHGVVCELGTIVSSESAASIFRFTNLLIGHMFISYDR